MSGDGALEAIRLELARLEAPLLGALVDRSHFRRNITALGRVLAAWRGRALAEVYRDGVIPSLCAPGDDGRDQESAAVDERLLSLLRTRVALGTGVADAKYRGDPGHFAALVRAGARADLAAALTDRLAEDRVLDRVRAFGLALGGPPLAGLLVCVFDRWIIPETKTVEVEHLLRRRIRPGEQR